MVATLITGTTLASDHCLDPVTDWQPKEKLTQLIKTKGWKINRIKVDDGCYEVKGFDSSGNRIEAEYYPATLRLRKFEIKFDKKSLIPENLPSGNSQTLPY